ncbi:hypothetical protein PoB_005355700 [Plakobranchus ocellatus]|uniref:Uncharacterized protein n=1 Tax=Plakobranchus ocellatus TaxID=259542 RepID=A0AAV4C6P2_9GAST|nr:hypothetical protein PoB_005355700 [Plakobranchus ocellatus]
MGSFSRVFPPTSYAEKGATNLNTGMTLERGVMEQRQAHDPHCTQGKTGWPYMFNKRERKYCQEKQSNEKKVYKAVEPQPASEDVLTLPRNYSKHAHSNDYVRRVTWLEEHQRTCFHE